MPGRKWQRRFVAWRVRTVVADGEVAHASDFEPGERLGIARRVGRGSAIEVADAGEDGIDSARFGTDEVGVACLGMPMLVVSERGM